MRRVLILRLNSNVTNQPLPTVAEHFAQWRRRKQKGDRIPEPLWSEALGLLGTYGVSQVTRTLRLSGTDLNKRRGQIGAGQRRQGAGGETAFVEIDPLVMDQASGPEASAVWMQLERPDGDRRLWLERRVRDPVSHVALRPVR